ncbi:MAG: outer membrane protein transport protein [Paracoccaceae bacterium]|nr:outer membrane protein transport protein [Paracoccaceae bacterium]
MRFAAAVTAGIIATQATGGGIDTTGQSVNFLFREGTVFEVGFGRVVPSISGQDAPLFGGSDTGNIGEAFSLPVVSFKHDFNDQLSFGIIVEKPFGAEVAYGPGSIAFAGTEASASVTSTTLLLRYKFNDRFSVYGGPRFQSAKADFLLSGAIYGPLSGYRANLAKDESIGYVVGAAFEIPEYFLRASLTYSSAIEHEFDTTEATLFGPVVSTVQTSIPQSLNFEFQTGIAPGTFVFGSARWVEWSKLRFEPPVLSALSPDPLVEFEDTVTYSLGIGRQFTDNWVGTLTLLYEPAENSRPVPLVPVDGFQGFVLGAIYMRDDFEFHANYAMTQFGDTTPFVNALGTTVSSFTGNTSQSFGVKLVQKF